ncbi:sugar phosphate isomerase/epimerase family protein [Lutimonas sp.]|uniref:sugar phosphate isomerase/epimerase family protein n=1 Tax=Lutimonas sp. TaxID=1872403 RepID=UPI003D9BCB65
MGQTRRNFAKKITIASLGFPFISVPTDVFPQPENDLEINIFSKHLQFLDVKGAAQVAAELGFDGIDLTVRPKGHIEPESVSRDLVHAIKSIETAGSSCKMITTAIEKASKPLDQELIRMAGKTGIEFYRSNWFKYFDDRSMEASIELYQNEIQQLSELNRQSGIIGCYQNHAGTKIGGSFWELQMLLESANKEYFGVQFDIRHAVAEGGYSWENGLRLLHQNIKTIVLKDFKWAKRNGKWLLVNVPIGEGMVDFQTYFKLLKSYDLKPPASLHLEYPLGGAEKGKDAISIDKKAVFNAMEKDLKTIRDLWAAA